MDTTSRRFHDRQGYSKVGEGSQPLRASRGHKYTESLPSLRLSDQITDSSLNLKIHPPILPPSLLVHVKPPQVEHSQSAEVLAPDRLKLSNSHLMNQKIFSLLREKSKRLQPIQHKRLDEVPSTRRIKPITSNVSPKHMRDNSSKRLEVHLSMQLQSNNISRFMQSSMRVDNPAAESTLERRSITELYRRNPSESKIPPLFGVESAPRDSTRAGSGELDASDLNTSTLNSPLYLKAKYSVRKSIVRGKYYDQFSNEQQSRVDYIEEQLVRSNNGSRLKLSKQPLPSDNTFLQMCDSDQGSHPNILLTQSSHRPQSRSIRNPEMETFKSYRSQMELIKAKIIARKSTTEANYRIPPGVLIEPSDFNQFYKTLGANKFLRQTLDERWKTPGRLATGESPGKNSSLRRRMTSKLLEVSPGVIGLSSSRVGALPETEEADGMSSSAFTSEQVSPIGTARRNQPKSPKKQTAKLNPKPTIRKFNGAGFPRKESVEPMSPAKGTLNEGESSEAKSPRNGSRDQLNTLSPKRRASEVHLLKELASGFAGFANLIGAAQNKRKSMLVPSTSRAKADADADKNKFHMNPKMLIVDSLNPMRNIVKLEQPVGLMHYETENKTTHYWSYWMKLIYHMLHSFDLFDQQTKVGYYSLYEPKGVSSRSKEDLERSGKKLTSKLTLDFGEDEKPGLSSAAQSSAEDPLGMFSNKQRKNMALLIRLEARLGLDLFCSNLDMQRNYREIQEQVSVKSYQYAPTDPTAFFLYREQLMLASKQTTMQATIDFSKTCAEMCDVMSQTETAKKATGESSLSKIAFFTEKIAGVHLAPESILGGSHLSFADLQRGKEATSPRSKAAGFGFTPRTFTLIPPTQF